MKKAIAILTVLCVARSGIAAPQVKSYTNQSEDNDVAIDISREVYVAPEEKIGYISEDVPANILSNRQRRETLEDNNKATSLLDIEDYQEEDPHLSAPAPSLPLAPDTPSADIPIELSESELNEETYIPPEDPVDAEPAESNGYLPPIEEPVEETYVPEEEPVPAHVFTPDGYEYKTVRRVQYRYRHRN